jgi:hypothetical protein
MIEVNEILPTDVDVFEEKFKKKPELFVRIHHPSCGHCKDMENDWKSLENILKNKYTGDVGVFNINADILPNLNIPSLKNINGYPTMMAIKNGLPIHYQGDRSADNMLKFCLKHLNLKEKSKRTKKTRRNKKKSKKLLQTFRKNVKKGKKRKKSKRKFRGAGSGPSAEDFRRRGHLNDPYTTTYRKREAQNPPRIYPEQLERAAAPAEVDRKIKVIDEYESLIKMLLDQSDETRGELFELQRLYDAKLNIWNQTSPDDQELIPEHLRPAWMMAQIPGIQPADVVMGDGGGRRTRRSKKLRRRKTNRRKY